MDFGPSEALEKMRKYCAYQERSHRDVSQKMQRLEIPSDWRDGIVIDLIQENFLNEERFARAYARGKFNIKKWGRIKIVHGLRQHQVSKKCIDLALKEIDPSQYFQVLKDSLALKNSKLKEKNHWKRKGSLYNYLAQRGFESHLITEALKEL